MYLISLMMAVYITSATLLGKDKLLYYSLPFFAAPLINDVFNLVMVSGLIFYLAQVILLIPPLLYVVQDNFEIKTEEEVVNIICLLCLLILNAVYIVLVLTSTWSDVTYFYTAGLLWLTLIINITRRGLRIGYFNNNKELDSIRCTVYNSNPARVLYNTKNKELLCQRN